MQPTLFKEPIGQRFRAKREALGLSIDDVARTLRFGTHLIDAIEHEDWPKLGAPVYAKSYISSYTKLLGLADEIRAEIPGVHAEPALKGIAPAPVEAPRRLPKWPLAVLCLLVLAALVGYLNLRQTPSDGLSMNARNTEIPIEKQAVQTAVAPAKALPPSAVGLIKNPEVLIRSRTQSWLEVRAKDGQILFSGTLSGTTEYRQDSTKIGKITIGNASSIDVSLDGVALDIKPLIRDEVVRFSLADDGKPVAYRDVPSPSPSPLNE